MWASTISSHVTIYFYSYIFSSYYLSFTISRSFSILIFISHSKSLLKFLSTLSSHLLLQSVSTTIFLSIFLSEHFYLHLSLHRGDDLLSLDEEECTSPSLQHPPSPSSVNESLRRRFPVDTLNIKGKQHFLLLPFILLLPSCFSSVKTLKKDYTAMLSRFIKQYCVIFTTSILFLSLTPEHT